MNRHIFGDLELARHFKNNEVSSEQKVRYLCGWLFVIALMFILTAAFHPYPLNNWDYILFLSFLAISFWGTIVCYESNKSGDNKDFIERYICIGFRVFLHVSFSLSILFFMLYVWLSKTEGPPGTSVYFVLLLMASLGAFYWRVNLLIKIASNAIEDRLPRY